MILALLESLVLSLFRSLKIRLQPRPRVAILITFESRPTMGRPLLRRLHGSPLTVVFVVR